MGILNVVFIDLVLAGDNALIIASAVRRLPPGTRQKAIWWGTLAAVAFRLAFLAVAVLILEYPYLHAAGGAYIIYIAVKLLKDDHKDQKEMKSGERFAGAVWIIVTADIAMSLDNVLAVAGASHGNFRLVVFGILLSVPIMIFASSLLSRLMQRYPAIVLAGSLILGGVGARMIAEERAFLGFIGGWHYPIQLAGIFLVLAFYFARKRTTSRR